MYQRKASANSRDFDPERKTGFDLREFITNIFPEKPEDGW